MAIAIDRLNKIQSEIRIIGPSNSIIDQERLSKIDLEKALHFEEIFEQQKASVKRHIDGDKNIKKIHKTTEIK